jgi:HPt (histidine-containing phosphotransfer) domain-containing protein
MSRQVAIYSTLGGDPDLGELVELFVSELPDRIETLEKNYETANWDELRRTAHQIKGAAGSYGFHALTPAAAKLEAAIKGERGEDQITADLNELLDLCRRVRAGVAG